MSKALVPVARSRSIAVPSSIKRPDEHPVIVYLTGLDKGSRPAMKSALNTIAKMGGGADLYVFPWQTLRFAHTKALRSKLVDRFAPRTVNRMLSAVVGVLKTAWRLELISSDDYHRAVDFQRMKTRDLPAAGRWLPQDEIKRLFEAARSAPAPSSYRDMALLTMLYAGGLRRHEASGLFLGDYTPKTGELKVMGKGKKFRTAYVPDGYRAWIGPWFGFRNGLAKGDAPFFVRWNRQGPTKNRLGTVGVDTVLGEITKRAKVADVSPHDLRRSFASELLDAGADLLMVQQLMGHASVETTRIYDRRGEAGKRKAVERMPVVMEYSP